MIPKCIIVITAINYGNVTMGPFTYTGSVYIYLAFVIACSILLFSIVLYYCSVSQMPNDASVLAFDMPFLAKESPFLAFQIKQRNQNKKKK